MIINNLNHFIALTHTHLCESFHFKLLSTLVHFSAKHWPFYSVVTVIITLQIKISHISDDIRDKVVFSMNYPEYHVDHLKSSSNEPHPALKITQFMQ